MDQRPPAILVGDAPGLDFLNSIATPIDVAIDWIDDGETPLCPRCGVDSVMIGVTDLMELLTMHRTRFGRPPGPASDPLNDN